MLAVERRRDTGEVLDAVGARDHVDGERLADRLAGVEHLEFGELVVALAQDAHRASRMRPRWAPVSARHCEALAARTATAASTSAADACCTVAITSPVAGLMVGNVSPLVASTSCRR